ncbi:MAG: MCE family protein [Kamptonema sp. SIO4C4]|nr:MCE family protein [Kamptonema sp. SIO4C4]
MRSRIVREGSVGLFILIGLAVFGTLTFWLRGLQFGQENYTFTVEFANTNGMTVGGVVRYRGVKVGTIVGITPDTNGILVTVSVSPIDLVIPKDSLIVANQSGLISETIVDITPLTTLPDESSLATPISADCDSTLIICHEARLEGETGLTLNDAVSSTVALSDRLTDPEFFGNVKSLTANASLAAEKVAALSEELTQLSQSFRTELENISSTTGGVTAQVTRTSEQLNRTAEEYRLTAIQLNRLVNNVNTSVSENRASLAMTLQNIGTISGELTQLLANANTTLEQVNASDTQQLLQNLEELTANANAASANLRDMTNAFSDPENVIALQRTLNSARVTFENAQKITSDLDELTGNPEFRQNLLRLVDGLSSLVSSTEQLEQRVQTAQELESTPKRQSSPTPTPTASPSPSPSTPQSSPRPLIQPSAVSESPTPKQSPQLSNVSPELVRELFLSEDSEKSDEEEKSEEEE